ncbi:ATP-binding cassette domain-containing protein [Elizabethkingia argentiflava]|uniref:ATP-binding cassette domain-containing protein n=1 Tax=Elizabethkingia argenteiflava TaxID=2681556 RepID=A0A845PWX1_9FLAO|nr:ABC transporter ATP-binding protein [Elizabethkingia argenteiflava]NAW51451.1 ATP-binding cassette domain-containing protein [Elizabethkingia argenteiflava]
MKKLSTGNIIVRLFRIGMKFRGWFISAFIISIAFALVGTYRPILTKDMIDHDIIKERDFTLLIHDIYLLIGLVIAETVLNFGLVYLSNFISQNVIRDIRQRLYNKLIYFKISFFDKMAIGQLVTRAVGDVETIATVYTDGFLMVFGDVLRVILVLIAMFNVNVQLSFIALVLLPIMLLITRFFQKRLKTAFGDERNWTSLQNSFVQERLSGMALIQVFNRQQAEFNKFDEINKHLKKALLRTVFFFSLFFPIVELISSVCIGLILFYAGYNALTDSNASPGDVIAFIQFVNMLIRPLRQIADRFNNIQRGLVGAERVLGIIDADHAMPNQGQVIREKVYGGIEFQEVYFSYHKKEEVLKGIGFKVNPGESVAIVGATGAGKSTIISLLTRFYDIDAGKILLDGIDLREYELYNLRNHIGVVSQDVFLFHGSIYENLTLGEDIPIEKIRQAAREIEVDEFIERLPGGYHYVMSERGASISLGQRQLLSFLRAYLTDPSILILDEATSSIDNESEKLIQRATQKITKNRTSIIIAHRLSTIVNADKIIVMAHGKIVEEGKHQELLKKKGYYATLYKDNNK